MAVGPGEGKGFLSPSRFGSVDSKSARGLKGPGSISVKGMLQARSPAWSGCMQVAASPWVSRLSMFQGGCTLRFVACLKSQMTSRAAQPQEGGCIWLSGEPCHLVSTPCMTAAVPLSGDPLYVRSLRETLCSSPRSSVIEVKAACCSSGSIGPPHWPPYVPSQPSRINLINLLGLLQGPTNHLLPVLGGPDSTFTQGVQVHPSNRLTSPPFPLVTLAPSTWDT